MAQVKRNRIMVNLSKEEESAIVEWAKAHGFTKSTAVRILALHALTSDFDLFTK